MPALAAIVLPALIALASLAQTPQPFPRPGAQQPQTASPATAAPQVPAAPRPQAPPQVAEPGAPSPAVLVLPLHPSARFIASYDATRGQRYYLFGSAAPFAEIVAFYRTELDDRGDLIFREPATHMFEVGRFRDETMAFPPGVTVKDWTSGGSQGYVNPTPGGQPSRFPTTIMIVPPPPTDVR